MDLAERLSGYVSTLHYDALDEATIHVVRQRVLDTLACAAGAIDSEPVLNILDYIAAQPGGSASVLFSTRRTTPELASFVNATMVRYLDYNDGYFSLEPGHSSDIIPACLAVAQAERLTGRDVVLAIVIAYEIQMRLQDAACLFRRGWDHVNYVTIAATMAVGKLLGLTSDQLTHALGMALNGHIALRQVRCGQLSGWKGASAANASRNAVFCAYLARHGMTGPREIFEGEMGFFKQLSGPFELDLAAFGNGRNQDFHIRRARTKLYPTNGEMQTAVIAAVKLRARLASLTDIARIRIDTTDVGYRFLAKDEAKWRPLTRETADHSLPYTVARALLDGTISRASYDDADLADPRVIEIIDKIDVREDPALTARMPSLANRVTIVTNDGVNLVEMVDINDEQTLQVSDGDLERKFRDAGSALLDEAELRKIIDLCWTIDAQPGVEPLLSALAPCGGRL